MTSPVSHLRAIFLAILGFTLWVIGDSFMKLASEAALPFYETAFFMGLFMALLVVVKAAPQGLEGVRALWPKKPKALLVRALLLMLLNLSNAIALKHLPFTLFYITVFTAPMMILLFAAIFLGERLTMGRLIAIIVGFIGVIVAINPTGDLSGGDWIGYATATFGVACFAGAVVWLRTLTQTESVDSIVFFSALVEAVLCLVPLLFHAGPVTLRLLGLLFGLALFGVAGNICNAVSLRVLPAATVAQFHYTQIIAAAVIGYFIWDETPTVHTIVGALVIIGAGLYIAAKARNHAAETAVAPTLDP